ncbi:MAG: dihydrofolate reductase family protein [Gaiellales bacterium]
MSEAPRVAIDRLFEAPELPRTPLPEELERMYGGPFGLAPRVVFGNFVASIDGVAAIGGMKMSSAAISGGAPADRFVMGLLRTFAEAVVIGSTTLREHPGPWTAERAFADAATHFSEARRMLALADMPTLVVMTGSGDLPPGHPALRDAIVVTTSSGARRMAERSVSCREVVEVADAGEVDPRIGVDALRTRGFERVLTEGGPRLMGSMLEASLVDELFLTISPKLIGGGPDRPPLTDGAQGLHLDSSARLLSAGRAGDYLLLRYDITAGSAPEAVET